MLSLGAQDALNLDGGGSSTMVAKRPSGAVRVANVPSDGEQRPVPEGIELVYTPPAG
jgi:exopolysaccharide biosynthesis protein